ncbi:hypothetical protein BESB_001690 [Besnoitia besnoiti]|uniref:Uncharacterized protein n=1 Tax=Besnoitia besnoiti TaxID=94643 RepID=A0A2A9MP90_BESBE|nr:hypothetical protein BESB_001690 [Besnoitia besnoiti]PFH37827.1 hypothetical protein BESB_001690 [Besnoitia besnoiti]
MTERRGEERKRAKKRKTGSARAAVLTSPNSSPADRRGDKKGSACSGVSLGECPKFFLLLFSKRRRNCCPASAPGECLSAARDMGIGGGPEAGDAGRAPSPPPHVACCDGRKEEAVATEKKREKLKKHVQREARKVEAQASKNGLDEGVHAADGATRSASSDLPSGARPVELREEKRRDHQNPRHRGDLGLRTRVTCEFGGAEGREREKKAEGDDEGTSKRQPEFPSDASTGAPWLFPIRRDWDYRFPEDVPELLQVVCSRINCRPLATDDQDNTRPSSALCSEDGEGMTARNGVAPSHETLEGERLLAVSERMVAEWKQRRAWRQREEKKKKHLAAVPLPPGAPHVTRAAAEEGDTKRSRGDEEVGERASLCALLAACRACPLSWAADGQKPGSKLRGAPAAVYLHHSRRRQPPLPPTEKRGAVCSVRGTGESKQIVSSLVEGPPALPSSPSATASGYERGAGLPAPWALTPESSSQTSFACRPPLLPPAPPSAVPGAPQPPAFLLNPHETWSACPQPPPPRHPQVGGSVCTPPQVEGTGAAAGGGGAPSGELTAAQGRGMMLAPLPPSARHAKAPAQRKHAQADVAVGGGLSGASKGGVRRREDEENRGSGGGRQDVEEGSRLGKREGGKKEGGARLAARYAAGAHPPGSGAGGRGGTGGATAVGDQGASGESVSWPEEVTKQAVRCAIGGTMHEFVRLPDGFSVCFANGNYGAGRFNGFIHLSLPSTGSSSSCPVVPGGYLLLEHAPSWQHPTPMPLFFLRATPRNSRELAEALASPFWARRHPARHLVYRHRAHMLRLLQDRPRKRGKNAQSGGQDQGGKHAATRGGLGEGGGGADGEVKQVPFRAVAEEANSAATANGPNVALGAEQKKSHRRRAEAAASRQAEVAEEEQRVAEGATSRKNRGEGPLAAKARESRKDGRDERGGRTDGEASAQSGEGERTKELDEQPKHTGSASAGCEAKEGGSPPQQGVASPAVSPVAEGNGGALPAPAARLQSFLPADRVGKKRAADRGGKRRQDAPAKCEKTPLPAEGKPRGSLREPQRGGEASRQGRPGCVEEVARRRRLP